MEILNDEGGRGLDPEQMLAFQIIERNSRRLRSVIENLLTISSVETGALSLSPAPTHFGPIIESAVSTVLPAAEEQGVELTARVPADLPPVWADPSHADRIVLNLLSNAIKFTPTGGHVEISAAPVAGNGTVTVRDDGIGIPEHEQARLFERFSRGSAAAERAIQGSGLGLFIVKRIVELHSGTVALRSAPGKGTEVTVTLPLVPRDFGAGTERAPAVVTRSSSVSEVGR
jgi:two-component system, OmpR family, phosphate regulon sensor histidine kinase PhoR